MLAYKHVRFISGNGKDHTAHVLRLARPLPLPPRSARRAPGTVWIHGSVGALFVFPDSMFLFHRSRIVNLARAHRVPSMFEFRDYVEVGGLISYGANNVDMLWRGALMVDRILRGSRPSELPFGQPTKFELVINLKIAKALGLTIPPSLLQRADQVIE